MLEMLSACWCWLQIIYRYNQYLTILDQEPHYIPTASSSDNTPTATEISLCSYRVLDRLQHCSVLLCFIFWFVDFRSLFVTPVTVMNLLN